MREQDIDRCLTQLGQELRNLGIQQPVRVLVIGGTFMLTQIGNRSITEDIDVIFTDIFDRRVSPIYLATLQAAKTVAARNSLRDDWFNDGMSHLLRTMGDMPTSTLWRRYGVLEIYLPPTGYILTLKLLAYRDKDKEDIEALCRVLNLRTREQAQNVVNIYVPDTSTQDIFRLEETLEKLF